MRLKTVQFDGVRPIQTKGSKGNLPKEAAKLGSGHSDTGEASDVCNFIANVYSFFYPFGVWTYPHALDYLQVCIRTAKAVVFFYH
jgi:hypothetical protein